jgi:peptidoglycan/LPS O-acetylase OafA/YrhL
VLKWGPLLYIGRISFGIYLWHDYVVFALFQWAARLNPRLAGRGTTLLVVGSALSIALASVSWFVIERPFNHLKRHFPYTRLKPGPPS